MRPYARFKKRVHKNPGHDADRCGVCRAYPGDKGSERQRLKRGVSEEFIDALREIGVRPEIIERVQG